MQVEAGGVTFDADAVFNSEDELWSVSVTFKDEQEQDYVVTGTGSTVKAAVKDLKKELGWGPQ